MSKRAALLVSLCLWVLAAQGAQVSGRLKLEADGYNAGPYTIEQALGFKTSHERAGEFRIAMGETVSRWRIDGAVQLDARNGTAVQRDLAIARIVPALATGGIDTDYWNLSRTFAYGGETQSTGRVDRLNIGWTGDHLVLRLGRQALTWGSGLVFHPMDLVNPFRPVATDTVYKRGTDMAYAQWLFDSGSDVQFAAVLRRRRGDALADDARNSYAMFANIAGGASQWSVLLARNRGDRVGGLGVSHALGSAVWNGELVVTKPADAITRVTLLSNISWATVWRGDNVTLFAEYYRNGFGEAQRHYTVLALDPALLSRLGRGDLFVTGRDYLSAGVTWGVTPLVQLIPTIIVNLRDHSSLVDLQASWSLSDNTLLKAGIRLVAGGRGTELRGLQLVPGTALYLASPDQAFLRLEHYFQGHP